MYKAENFVFLSRFAPIYTLATAEPTRCIPCRNRAIVKNVNKSKQNEDICS